jgi:hypothetical protein
MMQTADLRNLNNRSDLHRLNRPFNRGVFAQREVSPGTLVILEIGSENSPETGFIQHNDVIQTLAANRSDQSLDIRVLPRRLRRGQKLPDSERLGCFRELLAIASVAISKHVTRSAVPWKGFEELMSYHSDVGYSVTATCTGLRRSWDRMTKTNRT